MRIQIQATLPFLLFIPLLTSAQVMMENADESKLYAESKQVNQFFRRFNGEEDEKGNRYYPKDKQYRSAKLRKKYLPIVFDAANAGMSSTLKEEFVKHILEKPESNVLDFHGQNWFCEIQTKFSHNGNTIPVTLYMELEKAQLGTKWVIKKVFSEQFKPYFKTDTTKVGQFLHPMSHELDFMNLRKAFINSDSITQFASKKFLPDHLSLFLYEVKKGNLKYISVDVVKFHFFEIDGWYFELANFNREGYNSGWLISNLVKLSNPGDKEVMRKYLYHESK
jgi:hypothetical protein